VGLAAGGGIVIVAAYLLLAGAPTPWIAPVAVTFTGMGFYMLHNTLQTNATQMSPEARGTAVGLFSAALYLGQTFGVAAAAPVVDRYGAAPIFIIAGAAVLSVGLVFSMKLKKRQSAV
jgi:predicted MFS family arabinose efflux permease